CFVAERLKTTPSALSIEQLDPTLVLAFLEHLEKERGNCARTRNSRLAAIKTFFRFLEYRLPPCLDQARRIRAIPVKKTDEVIIGYLNREELQALLDAPDPSSRQGLRDRAMLHLAYAGGLRVSELVGLRMADTRSEEHTSELQSHLNLVCRLLLEKKKKKKNRTIVSQTKKKPLDLVRT